MKINNVKKIYFMFLCFVSFLAMASNPPCVFPTNETTNVDRIEIYFDVTKNNQFGVDDLSIEEPTEAEILYLKKIFSPHSFCRSIFKKSLIMYDTTPTKIFIRNTYVQWENKNLYINGTNITQMQKSVRLTKEGIIQLYVIENGHAGQYVINYQFTNLFFHPFHLFFLMALNSLIFLLGYPLINYQNKNVDNKQKTIRNYFFFINSVYLIAFISLFVVVNYYSISLL